jgi:DNA-directed RNA polymerase beta' subunit
VIFSTETNEHGRYYDKAITGPINVIRRLTGIDLHTRTTQDKQKRVASSMVEMAEFYSQYLKKAIFSKYGLVRQQLVSARSHFTARAVIVSIAGPHKHDELHLCWSVACSLFRPFIINALKRSGMSSRESATFLEYHNRIYHPLIDEILRELIAVSGGGIAALFSRNPSMHRGSIQTVRITRVKTDPNDVTFGMSDRIAPSYNADHDGRLNHCRHVNKLP